MQGVANAASGMHPPVSHRQQLTPSSSTHAVTVKPSSDAHEVTQAFHPGGNGIIADLSGPLGNTFSAGYETQRLRLEYHDDDSLGMNPHTSSAVSSPAEPVTPTLETGEPAVLAIHTVPDGEFPNCSPGMQMCYHDEEEHDGPMSAVHPDENIQAHRMDTDTEIDSPELHHSLFRSAARSAIAMPPPPEQIMPASVPQLSRPTETFGQASASFSRENLSAVSNSASFTFGDSVSGQQFPGRSSSQNVGSSRLHRLSNTTATLLNSKSAKKSSNRARKMVGTHGPGDSIGSEGIDGAFDIKVVDSVNPNRGPGVEVSVFGSNSALAFSPRSSSSAQFQSSSRAQLAVLGKRARQNRVEELHANDEGKLQTIDGNSETIQPVISSAVVLEATHQAAERDRNPNSSSGARGRRHFASMSVAPSVSDTKGTRVDFSHEALRFSLLEFQADQLPSWLDQFLMKPDFVASLLAHGSGWRMLRHVFRRFSCRAGFDSAAAERSTSSANGSIGFPALFDALSTHPAVLFLAPICPMIYVLPGENGLSTTKNSALKILLTKEKRGISQQSPISYTLQDSKGKQMMVPGTNLIVKHLTYSGRCRQDLHTKITNAAKSAQEALHGYARQADFKANICTAITSLNLPASAHESKLPQERDGFWTERPQRPPASMTENLVLHLDPDRSDGSLPSTLLSGFAPAQEDNGQSSCSRGKQFVSIDSISRDAGLLDHTREKGHASGKDGPVVSKMRVYEVQPAGTNGFAGQGFLIVHVMPNYLLPERGALDGTNASAPPTPRQTPRR